jgi:hypothetical protein
MRIPWGGDADDSLPLERQRFVNASRLSELRASRLTLRACGALQHIHFFMEFQFSLVLHKALPYSCSNHNPMRHGASIRGS